jgi:putative membrane protein
VAGLIGALTGVGAYVFAMVNRGFNFRAAIADDGIRLRHGLLETRRQTVPPGRVQAVRLRQSLLWRGKDWWHLTINVAGYQKDQDAVSTLLPVGPREEALLALRLVLPHVTHSLEAPTASDDDDQLASVLTLAMSGTGDAGGFVAAPRATRWLDPIQWRHRGVTATDTALIVRRGFFVREVFVVPHERTQSLNLAQGPIQRSLGLASVELQSTPGPVKPIAHHLAVTDALRLMDEQAERARRRRKVQTPEQWAKAIDDLGIEEFGDRAETPPPATGGPA